MTLNWRENKKMPESSTLSDEKHTAWPGRFIVRAEINYRDRRGRQSSMQVTTFQRELTREQVDALLLPLGFDPVMSGYHFLVSQARDTYSQEEAEALVAYLNTRKGTSAFMKTANLPTPNVMGASAIPSLPSFKDGAIYRYYTEPGYPLSFRVESINIKTYLYMARLFNEFHDFHEKRETG